MKALILGVTGQDGSYLAEQLVADGHEVFGMIRRPVGTVPGVIPIAGDLLDQGSLEDALWRCKPDVVFNLAAVIAPGAGWGKPQPPLLAEVTGMGVLRLLDAMTALAPNTRLVHASSSAIYEPHRYGLYGIAKQFAHEAVAGYRSRGLHASNAVLYSHTSPRQDQRFLLPRVCAIVKRIAAGSDEKLVLGDVDSRRDWGYAPDYMRVLRWLAEQPKPQDLRIVSRVMSVREVVEMALKAAGLVWDDVVRIDQGLPTVPDEKQAPVTVLPQRMTPFESVIAEMVQGAKS